MRGGGGNVEISFDDDDSGGGNGRSSTSELEEYLLQQKRGTVGGFFSNVGSGFQKFIPRRMGGTGSIENDIALRFGNLFGTNNGVGSSSTSLDSSSQAKGEGRCSCSLSRKERIIGFFLLLGLGILFFILSSFYIPVLLFAARKFSIFFTMGSVFTFSSLGVLWGFSSFGKHLVSPERLPFTAAYLGSLFVTLYFAIGLQSYTLTIIGIIVQVISLLSFVISYLPGGVSGMKYLVQMITSSVGRNLPI